MSLRRRHGTGRSRRSGKLSTVSNAISNAGSDLYVSLKQYIRNKNAKMEAKQSEFEKEFEAAGRRYLQSRWGGESDETSERRVNSQRRGGPNRLQSRTGDSSPSASLSHVDARLSQSTRRSRPPPLAAVRPTLPQPAGYKHKQVMPRAERKRQIQAYRATQLKARTEWFQSNGWLSPAGRVNLENVGRYLNTELERRRRLEKRMRMLQKRVKSKAETYEGFRWQQQGNSIKDQGTPERTRVNTGGSCKKPRLFAISYPGKHRGTVFKTLRSMKLDMSKKGDVYVMNDFCVDSRMGASPIPEEWQNTLQDQEGWHELLALLKVDEETEQILAPTWFVEQWGQAAFYAAKNHGNEGSGVIVLQGWEGYLESQWCEMEYYFCKALAGKFANSVYVVTGWEKRSQTSLGEYLLEDTNSYYTYAMSEDDESYYGSRDGKVWSDTDSDSDESSVATEERDGESEWV